MELHKKYGQANEAGKGNIMNVKTYLWNIFEVAREELTAAFTVGDRVAFEAILNE